MWGRIQQFLERLVIVKTNNEDHLRRGRILAILMVGGLFFDILLTIENIIEAILTPSQLYGQYILQDVGVAMIILGLWGLNRNGRVRLAAILFLAGTTIGITELFPKADLSQVFIFYTLPVTTASFLLTPSASLAAAAFANLLYLITGWIQGVINDYNDILVPFLFVIALVAWLAASSLEKNIAERRRTEEALRKSEAMYRFFIEESSDVIWQMDTDFRITYINAADEKMRGFSREEMLGKSVLENFKPEGVALLLQSNADRIRAENNRIHTSTRHYELEQKRKDGSYVWMEISVNPYRNSAGELIGYYGITRDITERKSAEETLRQSAHWMEEAERIGHLGGWVLDLKRGIAWGSAEALRIYGLKEPELTISRLQEIPVKDFRPALDTALKELISGIAKYDIEFQIVRQNDNAIRDVHSVAEYDVDTQRVFGVIQDNSERKRVENKIRESEFWLKETQRVGGLGSYILNMQTGLWDSSEVLDEIFGIGPEYLRSIEGWAAIVHPDHQDMMVQYFSNLLTSHQNFNKEYKITRQKDGEERWVHGVGNFDYDQHDQPIRMFGTIQDITERKKAEQALIASEQRFREVVNASPNIILIFQDDNFIYSNPAVQKLLGYTEGEIEALNLYALIHPDDRPLITQRSKNIEQGNANSPVEIRALTKSGQILHVETTSVPITVNDRMAGLVIWNDITTRKQAEERILQLNADLEQRVQQRTAQLEMANKDLESFSYSVSHDLRAPLRALNGFSTALAEDYGGQLDDTAKSYIQRILASTQRMTQLIDDLLRLSRVSRVEIHANPLDLSIMANQILEELQEQEPQRQVKTIIEPGVAVCGDRNLLHILMDNLLRNAWKFTSRHREATIEFGIRQLENETVYYIKDDGAGFDPNYSNKLFGVFQRLHHESEFPGTGIGLATVQRIVQRHNGRIWAESAVEQGATFYFTLGLAIAPC